MIRVRVKAAGENRRFKIVDAPRQQRVTTRYNRQGEAGISRMAAIIDARQKPADLIRIEQRSLVDLG